MHSMCLQFHLGALTPVSIGYEAWWSPELVWTMWRKEYSLASTGIRTYKAFYFQRKQKYREKNVFMPNIYGGADKSLARSDLKKTI